MEIKCDNSNKIFKTLGNLKEHQNDKKLLN